METAKNFEFDCQSMLAKGELKKAKEMALAYLELLFERKLATRGLLFLSSLPSSLLRKSDQLFFEISFLSFKGDFKKLAHLCSQIQQKHFPEKRKILGGFLKSLDHQKSLWKGHKDLMKNVLALFAQEKNLDFISLPGEKKFLIKMAFDALYDKELQKDGLKLIKHYAYFFEKKNLGHISSSLTGDKKGLEFFSKLKEEKNLELTSVDLGEDLRAKKKINKIDQLAKNLQFLIRTNQNQKAYLLATTLKKIDQNHPLLKDFFGEINTKKKEISTQKVIQTLLKKISIYASKSPEDPEISIKSSLRAAVFSLPSEELKNSYADFIFALNSLDFPDLSIELLESLGPPEGELESDENLFNKKYLLIKSLILAERFYEALDMIQDMGPEGACFIREKKNILSKIGEKNFEKNK